MKHFKHLFLKISFVGDASKNLKYGTSVHLATFSGKTVPEKMGTTRTEDGHK
jgi:hypothetical protein